MGLFDFFGGGTPADKAAKLKAKATQKYGDPLTRQKALDQLAQLKSPEAVTVLLQRFTFNVEPQTTDAQEKDDVFEAIVGMGDEAIPPVKEFLFRSEQATSWAIKILDALVPAEQRLDITCELLAKLGTTYTRDPEKKSVVVQSVEGKSDPRLGPLLVPFLEDDSDDVKIATLRALGALKLEAAREPILKLLTGDDTAKRVQTAAIAAVVESAFTVQGYREKVEARLSDPWFLDKAGAIKKRG
ncbi:MAG: HEAT repeat domain-containing protein [Myxococcaceae bacterium]|nr:HEAT repeat domain-containing protein [Myxococcaceae bacterium]